MQQAMQVLTSAVTVEWYTPPHIINVARQILGGIDLDPASNPTANGWIKADTIYTADDLMSGLARPWFGRVWLNPPFDDTPRWVDRMDVAFDSGEISAGLLLVNSAPGYVWWEELWRRRPVCLLRERLRFVAADGTVDGQAKKGQTLAYYGLALTRFATHARALGRVLLPEEGL